LNATRVILATVLLFGDCLAQSTPDLTQEEAVALLTNRVAPLYPALARQARIQGEVILRFTISEEGLPKNILLVSGHPILSPAAVEAVQQWRFRPYEVDEQPVEAETRITIRFRLGPTQEERSATGRSEWVRAHEQRTGDKVYSSSDDVAPPTNLEDPLAVSPRGLTKTERESLSSGVEIWCIVDAAGSVVDVRAHSSNSAIQDAAAAAAWRWKFSPARERGLPVAYLYTGRVHFRDK
jgi:TonB family protein